MDFNRENSEQVYTLDGSQIDSFIVYNNRVYTEEYNNTFFRMYISVDLEGGESGGSLIIGAWEAGDRKVISTARWMACTSWA
ncbi:hypothetical protein [Desulfosporosinus shakirovi]|uniref:hypothetical protein n=1 Tax=Desulfosporosinus shakirovi TaxID=2885154 RepID=UPI001E3288B6|nr:hypothetical protein [Desulfosporosinus sp. SRJS8]MCB8818101.1 hypothetical protein [Desulfosporosinus sp. SRJS8]